MNQSEISPLFTEYKVTRYIWTIIPPLLLAIGTVGNCITIIVYTASPLRTTTMAVYLQVLAVSDTVALYTGLLTEWLTIAFDSKIKDYNSVGCKIHSWLLFTSVQFSACIVAAITLERVICVWFPFRSRRVESTKCAKVVVIFLCCILMVLNSHALYGMINGFEKAPLVPACTAVDDGYLYFFQTVWPFIDSTVYCFVPCSVIVTGNSLILYKIKRNKRPIYKFEQESDRDQEAQSLLPLIFTLNTVFVLTTAPTSIYQVALNFTYVSVTEEHSLRHVRLFLGWTILLMIMFSNHAINWLLYCLSGKNFRREVFSLFLSIFNILRRK
ncbi:galanin receptor 2a-like isoform X3 [Mercenaria mercenaria]|uniref:galanin receptor 2a-like isoform X3 n=1 Tax=Mercenaria mercenaria TaxID=6596 RepID=UPI001E1DC3F9|nr:galanin receptor 2a-like isoform X3 [Mercenaria mercenaria]